MSTTFIRRLAATFCCTLVLSAAAIACDVCGPVGLTLSEQMESSQVTVLVQYTGGVKSDPKTGSMGTTLYKVLNIIRDDTGKISKGTTIAVDRFRKGDAGNMSLMLGTDFDGRIEWQSTLEVTETSYQYIAQAPPRTAPEAQRLAYFVKFLEYPDPMISADAYGEFANAPNEAVTQLGDQIPRDKVRQWLTDPAVQQNRTGLYGLLLGLCGTAEDAEFLKQIILKPTEEFRLGIDGVMIGYLMLAKVDGLRMLTETKLVDTNAPFSETFSAMQALRFMWTSGGNRISQDELRTAMRVLLFRPKIADMVIIDLARWQDWSIMSSLMEMYGNPDFSVNATKRAIIRFMLVASKSGAGAAPEEVAEQAKVNLAKLREVDPKTVEAAERYFFQ